MKKRVLSALLALCLTLSLAGAAFAENETLSPAQETSVSESASSAAEPQEEIESEAEAEEISTAETAQEPSYPAQDFEAAVDGADMTVNVSAPEGALPADVTLTASLVGSSEDNADDQAVADVAAELDDADVEYDGFVALDISFVDADGNKVEPLQPVSVNFTLPAELLPEDVDASTLEVQHLKEDAETEEVVAVETVADTADATEGTVTVDTSVATLSADSNTTLPADAAVTAEFSVDGFSTFTITWDRVIGGEFNFGLEIKDTDGQDITLPDGQYNLSYKLPSIHGFQDGEIRTIEQIVSENKIDTVTDVNGQVYVFQNATFVEDGIRRPIRAVQNVYASGQSQLKVFDSVLGDNGVWTRSNSDLKNCEIQLVYRHIEDSSTEVYEPEPIYTKQATTTDGGKTYDLALTVSGDVGESKEKLKVDILFIVDQSGSMNEYAKPNYQEMVAGCARDLATGLANNNNLDTRFAVVTFGSGLVDQQYYKDALPRLSWTSDATKVYDAANPDSEGGTNYQAGLLAGRSAMIESRPDAQKFVVFLSDGQPTYHYTSSGKTEGGASTTTQEDIQNALSEAANYSNVNGFFTVSVGTESTAGTYLDQLSNTVCNAVGVAQDNPNFSDYTATNSAELAAQFEKIEAQITAVSMKDVSITDTLSQYVEPVAGEQPYMLIKNEEGETVTSEDGNYKVVYNSTENPKVFTVDFTDDYALKQNYTYELHFKVQPTDAAYSAYASSGYPTDTIGQDNTGTYAGMSGFYSNVENTAKLKYTTSVRSHELDYPMPVIRVPSTSLTINKVMENLPAEQWDAAADKITFTVKDGATPVVTINLGTDPATDANYTIVKTEVGYQVVITGLTVTKSYTVTETCDKLEGYIVTSDLEATGKTVPMDKDSGKNVIAVTNTYVPDNQTLTITKTVSGEMGSYTDDFTFDLVLSKAVQDGEVSYYDKSLTIEDSTTAKDLNGNPYTGILASTGAEKEHYTFVLSSNEQMILSVPYGYDVKVSERQENNGYSVQSRKYMTGTDEADKPGLTPNGATQEIEAISKDYTVEFENRRDPVAPTGLEDNHTKPFGLMVGVAVMAGLALAGGAVARRRRRWME